MSLLLWRALGKSQLGPENSLMLSGHGVSFLPMGIGDTDILSTVPNWIHQRPPGPLRYEPVCSTWREVEQLHGPILEVPYLGILSQLFRLFP